MLLKGTIKNNTLSTEIGDFFVTRKGNHEITGIFEIESISSSHLVKKITVDGFSTTVNIPTMEAKISAIYTKKYDCTDQSAHIDDVSGHLKTESITPPSTDIVASERDTDTKVNVDPMELELFGKPLSELENPFKIDASLDRHKQRTMIDYLKERGAQFSVAKQVWHLDHLQKMGGDQ